MKHFIQNIKSLQPTESDDPLRKVTFMRMIYDGKKLEEFDEGKLIKMIGRELKSYLIEGQEVHSQLQNLFTSSSGSSEEDVEVPGIFNDIAENLGSVDSSTPELFNCQFIEFVDSGGQPQIADVLPLIFRSQQDHHIVVIRLDQNLDDKPKNSTRKVGKKKYSEHVKLTNLQLIERACQLAKSSQSKVIVVGTRLNAEDEKEILEEKNKRLEVLEKKYPDTLVSNEEGFIATVNINPENGGDDSNVQNLHNFIFDSNFLENVSEEEAFVSLTGMILELELRHRSKGDVIAKKEFYNAAKLFGITSDDKIQTVLAFLRKFSGYSYYLDALPEVIFTSTSPIISRLFYVIHHSFSTENSNPVRLSVTGRLKKKTFFDLCNKAQMNAMLPNEKFLKLMQHLCIICEINENKLFIPSLLSEHEHESIDSNNDCFHPQPLVFFLQRDEDDDELMMLPQPFYHALIVKLLLQKFAHWSKTTHSRSNVTLGFMLNEEEYLVRFVNRAYLLEVFAHQKAFSPNICKFLFESIERCARFVLEQDGIQIFKFGIPCFCKKEPFHPCSPPANTNNYFVFTCFLDAVQKQEIKDDAKFWFKHRG